MIKAFLSVCLGVATLLFFLVLGIFAFVKKEIAVGVLHFGIGCTIFMAAVLYAVAAACRLRSKENPVISCKNCGSAFAELTENTKICPDCGSDSLTIVEY